MNRRATLGFLAAAACGLTFSGPVMAEEPITGTVRIESTSIALGIGVTWGEGQLTYNGQVYKFDVSGLSIVDLGVSSVTAVGKVYRLKKLEDFPGTFVAGQAGAALGGGVAATSMENQNGVIINLSATQAGAKLTLAAEGVRLSWAD